RRSVVDSALRHRPGHATSRARDANILPASAVRALRGSIPLSSFERDGPTFPRCLRHPMIQIKRSLDHQAAPSVHKLADVHADLGYERRMPYENSECPRSARLDESLDAFLPTL